MGTAKHVRIAFAAGFFVVLVAGGSGTAAVGPGDSTWAVSPRMPLQVLPLPPVPTTVSPPLIELPAPTLPPATVPTLPPVTAPTLAPVTAPTLAPVTSPTLAPVTAPTLPGLVSSPSPTSPPAPAAPVPPTSPQVASPPTTQLGGRLGATQPAAATVDDKSATVSPQSAADTTVGDLQLGPGPVVEVRSEFRQGSDDSGRLSPSAAAAGTQERSGRLQPANSQLCADPDALMPWLRELICPASSPSPDVASGGPMPILGSGAAKLATAAVLVLGAGVAIAHFSRGRPRPSGDLT